jgi:hypothetical protein
MTSLPEKVFFIIGHFQTSNTLPYSTHLPSSRAPSHPFLFQFHLNIVCTPNREHAILGPPLDLPIFLVCATYRYSIYQLSFQLLKKTAQYIGFPPIHLIVNKGAHFGVRIPNWLLRFHKKRRQMWDPFVLLNAHIFSISNPPN